LKTRYCGGWEIPPRAVAASFRVARFAVDFLARFALDFFDFAFFLETMCDPQLLVSVNLSTRSIASSCSRRNREAISHL
jgi:hypothetical protein